MKSKPTLLALSITCLTTLLGGCGGEELLEPISAGIYFDDSDSDLNEVAGGITVLKTENPTNVTGYALYWGASSTQKLGQEPAIASWDMGESEMTFQFAENSPMRGTHLLAYTRYDHPELGNQEATVPTAIRIEDYVKLTEQTVRIDDYYDGGADSSDRVSISGNTAVIANEGDDNVTVLERNANGEWVETATLVASDPGTPSDHFGSSVAINGDTIIVGARLEGDFGSFNNEEFQRGAAYIFERTAEGWQETIKLLKEGGSEDTRGRNFGFRVAVDGNYAAVAEAGGNTFIYKRTVDTWVLQQELETVSDWIPPAIVLKNDTLCTAGDVYALDNGVWTPQLLDIDCIDIDGNLMTAGSPISIYQRENDTWFKLADLVSPDGSELSQATISKGYVTAISGGAFNQEEMYLHVFENYSGSWIENAKLSLEDRADLYGFPDAMRGKRTLEMSGDILIFAEVRRPVYIYEGIHQIQTP